MKIHTDIGLDHVGNQCLSTNIERKKRTRSFYRMKHRGKKEGMARKGVKAKRKKSGGALVDLQIEKSF